MIVFVKIKNLRQIKDHILYNEVSLYKFTQFNQQNYNTNNKFYRTFYIF